MPRTGKHIVHELSKLFHLKALDFKGYKWNIRVLSFCCSVELRQTASAIDDHV